MAPEHKQPKVLSSRCRAKVSYSPDCVKMKRPEKITFGEMRLIGVRGLIVYCSDYTCSHSVHLNADRWSDDLRLSDIESRFTCQSCGIRGADVGPDFNWEKEQRATVPFTADHSIPG